MALTFESSRVMPPLQSREDKEGRSFTFLSDYPLASPIQDQTRSDTLQRLQSIQSCVLGLGVYDMLGQVSQHDSPRCRITPDADSQADMLPSVRYPHPYELKRPRIALRCLWD
jgi:hypothetical protein